MIIFALCRLLVWFSFYGNLVDHPVGIFCLFIYFLTPHQFFVAETPSREPCGKTF